MERHSMAEKRIVKGLRSIILYAAPHNSLLKVALPKLSTNTIYYQYKKYYHCFAFNNKSTSLYVSTQILSSRTIDFIMRVIPGIVQCKIEE